jgi:phosphoserine phosphatase
VKKALDSQVSLAAFDMDGTLLVGDSSWSGLHRHFGTAEKASASLKLYAEGKIDYLEFMRRDISLWPAGLSRNRIDEILSHYVIRDEAAEVVNRLWKRGIDVAMITSGIDILAEKVARDLGINHWVANGLQFNKEGILLKEGIGRVDPTRKDIAYAELLSKLNIDSQNTIAVGDTIYDLAFLKSARTGFMLAHTTHVDEPGIIHINRLTEIFDHI